MAKTKKKRLYKIKEQAMICGVAAGFAEYFEMDVTVMRAIFIVSLFLTGGMTFWIYLLMCFIMPEKSELK